MYVKIAATGTSKSQRQYRQVMIERRRALTEIANILNIRSLFCTVTQCNSIPSSSLICFDPINSRMNLNHCFWLAVYVPVHHVTAHKPSDSTHASWAEDALFWKKNAFADMIAQLFDPDSVIWTLSSHLLPSFSNLIFFLQKASLTVSIMFF